MEFEEMKKVWDTQNNEPIFIIDMKALHKSVRKKRNHARFTSNLNEWGLIFIAVVTSTFLILRNLGEGDIFTYLPIIMLLMTGVYVFFGRIKRLKREKQFDKTILGDLDQTISNVDFEIKRARTFALWYMLPLVVPITLNLYMKDASMLKWILITISFILSYFVVNWSLNKMQMPYKRKLLSLREKITQEIEED